MMPRFIDCSKKGSEKDLADFAIRFSEPLKIALKEQLYAKSPLRNEFQIRPLEGGETPIYENRKRVYVVREGADMAVWVKGGYCPSAALHSSFAHLGIEGKLFLVPLFEIASNPLFPFSSFSGMSNKEILTTMFSSKGCKGSILEEEIKWYKKMKKYHGKGIFVIRTDLQVLVSNEPKKQLIGYSIFEQIGIAIIQ
jgi:hypothetical protein